MKKDHSGTRRFWQDPRIRWGGISTILLCLGIAILVALNLVFTSLEKKNAWRVDYSFNALTSYGRDTEEVLSGLKNPVHIYALYSRGS